MVQVKKSSAFKKKRLFNINFEFYTLFQQKIGIYEVPQEVNKDGKITSSQSSGPFTEPVSAILAPSSITHKTSPTLQLKTRKLDPSADTGKDTQQLVEEDKSDC